MRMCSCTYRIIKAHFQLTLITGTRLQAMYYPLQAFGKARTTARTTFIMEKCFCFNLQRNHMYCMGVQTVHRQHLQNLLRKAEILSAIYLKWDTERSSITSLRILR